MCCNSLLSPDLQLSFFKKTKYTIKILTMVSTRLMFLDVAAGFLDSVHDGAILRSSQVDIKCEAGEILIKLQEVIGGEKFRPKIF